MVVVVRMYFSRLAWYVLVSQLLRRGYLVLTAKKDPIVEGLKDILTFKQPNLTKHVTYRHKHPPPTEWLQFASDPMAGRSSGIKSCTYHLRD